MQPLQQSPIIQSTVVEDLEDPNPSIDVEALNREVFQRDKVSAKVQSAFMCAIPWCIF